MAGWLWYSREFSRGTSPQSPYARCRRGWRGRIDADMGAQARALPRYLWPFPRLLGLAGAVDGLPDGPVLRVSAQPPAPVLTALGLLALGLTPAELDASCFLTPGPLVDTCSRREHWLNRGARGGAGGRFALARARV